MSTYNLPPASVEQESQRLNFQNEIIRLALGGSYPAKAHVQDILSAESGKDKAILDLGCGSGSWLIDMATEFPHIQALGLDLVPGTFPDDAPSNVKTGVYDVNEPLTEYYHKFDLVHMRMLGMGVRDFRCLVEEAAKCLKPGGMLLMIEADKYWCGEDQSIPMEPAFFGVNEGTGSWLARVVYAMRGCLRMLNAGMEPTSTQFESQGFWGHPSFDQNKCGYGRLWTPTKPWEHDLSDPHQEKLLSKLGDMGRQLLNKGYHLNRMLQVYGFTEQETARLWEGVASELHHPDLTKYRGWFGWCYIWGCVPGPSVETYSKKPLIRTPTFIEHDQPSLTQDTAKRHAITKRWGALDAQEKRLGAQKTQEQLS